MGTVNTEEASIGRVVVLLGEGLAFELETALSSADLSKYFGKASLGFDAQHSRRAFLVCYYNRK